jgi:hypothetical protein
MINPIKYNGEILSHVARVGVDGGTVENPEILNYDLETSLQATESSILDNNLDTAFAYSFRKLSSNYQGPCVRVRRSNDNVETDIFFSNNVLDEAALLTFVGGFNAHIVTWYDQTGKGNHLVQLTAANQPKIVVSGVIQRDNGNIVALFDDNVQSFNLTTPYTFTADTFSRSVVKRYIENINEGTNILLYEANWSTSPTGSIFQTKYTFSSPRYYAAGLGNQFINLLNKSQWLVSHNEILINKFGGVTDDNISQYVYYIANNIEPTSVNINRDHWLYTTILSPITNIRTTDNNYAFTVSELIYWNGDISNQLTNIRENTNRFYNLYWNGSQNSILNEFSGAAAAYSLRALNSNYTGPLVKVRRSSDNTEADVYALRDGSLDINGLTNFIGAQNLALNSETIDSWGLSGVVINSNVIASPDGTLTADLFTNTVINSYISNNLSPVISGGSTLIFSWYVKKDVDSVLSCSIQYHQSGSNGTNINFNFDTGVITGGVAENVGNGWWRISCSTTLTAQRNQIRILNFTTSSFYLWGLQLTQNIGPIQYNRTTTAVAGNGFITTWYDQSGNNRHQTQATATKQAKIVEPPNGLIINPENGKPSLLLDGTDDGYSTTMSIPTGTTLNLISVLKTNDPNGILYLDNSVNTRWTFILQSGSSSTDRSDRFTISSVYKNSIFQTLPTRNDFYLAFGNNVTHLSFMQGVVALADWTRLSLFDYSSFNLGGYSQEIIIYTSDQSQNRTRIETNINQYYNIYWNGTKAGVLDSYPSSAAAYSLRALSSTYTGPLVRVRRASDNAESDFYALYDGGLDVSGLSNFCVGTDGFVATWYDQSGNGANVSQTTAANQPQIVSLGSVILENGVPALLFDGANDNLSRQNFSWVNYSMFSTHKSNKAGVIWQNGNQNGVGFNRSALRYSLFERTIRDNLFGIANNNLRLISGIRNESISKLNGYINNVLYTLSPANALTPTTGFYIGTLDGTTSFFGGRQLELILYSSDQSQNRAKIESNINRYYNIYWDGSVRGVLDSYPNSAAAYSLRALSSTYTGPLIKVRRSSDNLETDIYATYNGDLDVNDLTDFCSGTNGFVTTWYDQSGKNNNAVQTTASNQPQIVASGSVILENGKPAMYVNGLSQGLVYFGFALSSPFSAFVVVNSDNLQSYPYVFGSSLGPSDSLSALGFVKSNTVRNFGLSVISYNRTYTGQKLFTSIRDTSNSWLGDNGVVGTTQNENSNQKSTSNRLSLFYNSTTSNNASMNGTGQEFILYINNQLENRLGIENNINRYYNIY